MSDQHNASTPATTDTGPNTEECGRSRGRRWLEDDFRTCAPPQPADDRSASPGTYIAQRRLGSELVPALMSRTRPLSKSSGLTLLVLVVPLSLMLVAWFLSGQYGNGNIAVVSFAIALVACLGIDESSVLLQRRPLRPEKPADPYSQATIEFGSK